MWGRFVYWLASWVLKNTQFGLEERTLFTGLLLDKLDALPLHAIIANSESGSLLIQGEELDFDRARVLRERANSALDNQALTLAWEQVRWTAFKQGLATGLPPEGLIFYRAAIWFSEEQKKHLELLAQRVRELSPEKD